MKIFKWVWQNKMKVVLLVGLGGLLMLWFPAFAQNIQKLNENLPVKPGSNP